MWADPKGGSSSRHTDGLSWFCACAGQHDRLISTGLSEDRGSLGRETARSHHAVGKTA